MWPPLFTAKEAEPGAEMGPTKVAWELVAKLWRGWGLEPRDPGSPVHTRPAVRWLVTTGTGISVGQSDGSSGSSPASRWLCGLEQVASLSCSFHFHKTQWVHVRCRHQGANEPAKGHSEDMGDSGHL